MHPCTSSLWAGPITQRLPVAGRVATADPGPSGRWAQPEETGVTRFLASDDSSHTIGQVPSVSGHLTMR